MKNVLKNFLYNTGYQMLVILIPIITTPYLARIIGAEGVGKFSYSNSIAYYFVMFIMLGLNNYGNRTVAEVRDDREKLSKIFCEIYYMQFVIGIFVLSIYILFCAFFMRKNIIQWIMLINLISAILDINWFFFGLEQFRFTVIRNVVIKLVSTVCIFVFVKEKQDIYIYIFISLFSALASNLVLWTVVYKYISFVRITVREALRHLKPNLVLFIPIVAVSLYKYMDKTMLGIMTNMTQVGYYEYSEKIIQIPLALVNSLGTVMLPKMTNLVANNKNNEEKKIIGVAMLLAMFCSSSLCFGLMGIAKEFVPFFYGEGYEECIVLFYILLPSCCFIAFANVIRTQYLIPHKEDIIYIKSVLLGAVVNAILNILLINILCSKGAAIATLIAEIVVCVYQAKSIHDVLDIKSYFFNAIPFVFSGLVMFIVIMNIELKDFSYMGQIAIKILVGIIIYFITLLFSMQFNKDELHIVKSLINDFRKR